MSRGITPDEASAVAGALADAFERVRDRPESFDPAAAEALTGALDAATGAILSGDYDTFKLAVAMFCAHPGLLPCGRSKWRLADLAGDAVWRMNRDLLKEGMRADLDRFLDELLG
jgi:hypothetical protein